MQNWKIKRMSVNLLEKWLDSVDYLLAHYLRMKKLDINSCPLCWSDCDDCLWNIIEGMDCEDFAKKLYPDRDDLGAGPLRQMLGFKKWKDARIKQLHEWRRIISGELARRYVKK